MTTHQVNQPQQDTVPDRVRVVITPPETAPSEDHTAVWLEEDGAVYGDYPTSPEGDAVVQLVWADGQPASRRDLAARGIVLTPVAACMTDALTTFGLYQLDGSARFARLWRDQDGDVCWADYPTADPHDDLVRNLVWAREQAESRAEMEEQGYVFTRVGWNR
jgi:hypothetical protein